MKRYGFYGGSFNPPTKAHIELVIQALIKFKLDKVFFVPVGNSYNKQELIDEMHRFNMLKLAISDNKALDVLDIELNTNLEFKAIDVFNIIQGHYRKSKNFFIMGADNFRNINLWMDYDNLINNFNYIILPRDNIEIQTYDRPNINILRNVDMPCSSTKVRELIKNDKREELLNYVPEKVVDYINKNKLYDIVNV